MFNKYIVSFTAIVALTAAPAPAQYYHGTDGPIPLKIDSARMVIKFEETYSPFDQEALMESIQRVDQKLDDDHVIDDFAAYSLFPGGDYLAFLDSLKSLEGIYLAEPYYLAESDSPMVVGETFIAAFDSTITLQQIDSINAIYSVVMDRELMAMPNVYILRNTDESGYGILNLANAYYDLDQTQYSHPRFGVRVVPMNYKLYDHYRSYQTHIRKIIGEFNVKTVWDFAGIDDTVVVAVVDMGVTEHEDLPFERLLPGYDFADDDDTATPGLLQAHGMACAGIIGASHTTDSIEGLNTSSGIISLNTLVKILPVKIFDDSGRGGSPEVPADAISWAVENGADIISNSWGFRSPTFEYQTLTYAIDDAFLFGRNGLGCPVIFSSGNGAEHYPDTVAYPARLWSAFAVGAIDLGDYRWEYSQYGDELDVVAPSGALCLQGDLWSLDQMNDSGQNPQVTSYCGMPVNWNCGYKNDVAYHCHFGGTSGATPIVSGVASLLLARRPDLSAASIYNILRRSAVSDLDFASFEPPHEQYGYGRVDAFRAMLAITRGDANNDGDLNVGDYVYIINYVFKGGPPPEPDKGTGDANCDGFITVADGVYISNFIFKGGPEPPICFEYEY